MRVSFINMKYDENFFPLFKEVEVFRKGPIYNLIPLKVESEEYNDIWRRMNMKDIEVKSIERVENYFLKRSFNLKRAKKLKENGCVPIHELILFHGTDEESAKNIIKKNFNWRLYGKRSRHWYHGKGVYFSCDATVSRRYPKRTIGLRYMILSKVLFTTGMIGNESITIPPLNTDFDTTFSTNCHEVVKYEDNEFCPTHLITFIIKNNQSAKSHITIDADTSRSVLVPKARLYFINKTKQSDEENKRQNISKMLANAVYESASNINIETVHSNWYASTSKGNWSDEEDLYSDSSDTESTEKSSESEEDTDVYNGNLHVIKFYKFVLNLLHNLKSIFMKPYSENYDSDNSDD